MSTTCWFKVDDNIHSYIQFIFHLLLWLSLNFSVFDRLAVVIKKTTFSSSSSSLSISHHQHQSHGFLTLLRIITSHDSFDLKFKKKIWDKVNKQTTSNYESSNNVGFIGFFHKLSSRKESNQPIKTTKNEILLERQFFSHKQMPKITTMKRNTLS